MGKYSEFISEKRRSIETPEKLVDDNGQVVFGTFNKEFKTLNLLDAKKPTMLPNFTNKLKLTLWEASEIHLKEGLLLVAVSDMSFFGITKAVFFDYRTRKTYTWDNTLPSKKTIITPNLIDGSISEGVTKNSHVKFTNNFEIGEAKVEGFSKSDVDIIEFNLSLKKLSDPSIVFIPFGDNRPLYSEKMFFKVTGYVEFNGERFESDDDTLAIIDDHKGYYPRRAHYDWLTAMGKNENGNYMAFNLTRNQSINQEDHNENIIWFSNKTSLLPPVTFTKDKDVKYTRDGEHQIVHIKDEHGMVDITYEVEAISAMITHALLVNIDYYITLGKIKGYILDEDGNKYILDDFEGVGEDKTLLL